MHRMVQPATRAANIKDTLIQRSDKRRSDSRPMNIVHGNEG